MLAGTLWLGLAWAGAAVAAPKTDVIVLNNGDRLTVEIKSMSRGRLSVKTDSFGTPNVDWGDVVSIRSTRTFEVEVTSGLRYFGTLAQAEPNYVLVEGLLGTKNTFALLDVIRLTPIGASFWSRLDGDISFGFNYTQASQQTQMTLDAEVEHRRRGFVNKATLSSQITTLEQSSQSRSSLAIASQRLLRNRWFTGGMGQFQQDESLGLNFRSVLGGVGGRYLKQTSQVSVSAFSGLAYTMEHFEGESADNSLEAVAGADWEWFSPANSDWDLSVNGTSFFNITGRSRARVEFNSSLKRQIFRDFKWGVNVFDSFDGAPPADQKKNDFGFSLSLGWSF